MTDKKWTAADVVVGATVTVRETYYGQGFVTVTTYGPDEVARVYRNYVSLKAGSGFPTNGAGGTTVEILDVQPPKPEYVVGGIYPVTTTAGRTGLREFYSDGMFGTVGGGSGVSTPENYARWGWTIGDRVLVIDYPDATFADHLLGRGDNESLTYSATLIRKALRAEAKAR